MNGAVAALMHLRYNAISYNGDATTSYDVDGPFPIKFSDFFKYVRENSIDTSIEVVATNECYGGWVNSHLRITKDGDLWYWSERKPENWYDEIKDLNIIACRANGGWGQTTYYVTFDEPKPEEPEQSTEAPDDTVKRLTAELEQLKEENLMLMERNNELAERGEAVVLAYRESMRFIAIEWQRDLEKRVDTIVGKPVYISGFCWNQRFDGWVVPYRDKCDYVCFDYKGHSYHLKAFLPDDYTSPLSSKINNTIHVNLGIKNPQDMP